MSREDEIRAAWQVQHDESARDEQQDTVKHARREVKKAMMRVAGAEENPDGSWDLPETASD
jgi:hypothetical protein